MLTFFFINNSPWIVCQPFLGSGLYPPSQLTREAKIINAQVKLFLSSFASFNYGGKCLQQRSFSLPAGFCMIFVFGAHVFIIP